MGMGSRGGVIHFYPFVLLFLALTYNTCPSFSSSSSSSSAKNHNHMCRPNQRDALLRFKNAYNITAWDEHVDCCLWNGITCDNITGDVIEVYASDFNLMGTISHIGYLSPLYNLQELDLEGNHLHGVIPPELSHFSRLRSLYLGFNLEITMESHSLNLLIKNLTQLEFLCLKEVKISEYPLKALVNISNALKYLVLDGCDLHGVLPESIFHLPNLLCLVMSENIDLMVSFPTLNRSSPLEVLDLSSTNFSGKLPNSIGNLKNLLSLHLSSLHISNPLPSSIENLTRLTDLSLSSCALGDAFPSSICRLSSLENLFLPDNKFSSTIPQCLWNLTKLYLLDLSYNQLTGLSPPLSANFISKLSYLDVSFNIISDTIAHSLHFFANLLVINLGDNNFHGEIPSSLCKGKQMIVDLSNNSLTGTIPPCLINNDAIRVLNLRMNKLEGTIPNTFPLDCIIEEIDLSENRLKGPLPRSMVNCNSLVVLELGNNNIEDCFPSWLETLLELRVLVLTFNKLHGELKTLLNHHPFPKLRIFDISNNNFTGLLPTEYITWFDAMKDTNDSNVSSIYMVVFSLYKYKYHSMTVTMKGSIRILPKVLNALKLLDFSNNNFYGEIPKIIGTLIALKGLNLSHNSFIGNIPPSIQNMTRLEWLDLSSNRLTGQIPNGLAQLTELESLNLSHNELRGMIPKGKQLDTFGKDSFVGNAGLCGSQIEVACGKPYAPQQPPLPSMYEDNFDVFDWKIILMGYGCGLVIGLSIGYIVFELQRPEWFVSLVEEKLLKKIMRPRRRENRLHRT